MPRRAHGITASLIFSSSPSFLNWLILTKYLDVILALLSAASFSWFVV